MSEIRPVKKSSTEDRSNSKVELWVPYKSSKKYEKNSFIISGKNELTSHLKNQIDQANEQVFITTGMMDETLAEAIEGAISRGVSFYILLKRDGFLRTISDLPESVLNGSLIRSYDGFLPCSILIDAKNGKGFGSILRSSTRLNRSLDQSGSSWAISLNSYQTSSLTAEMIIKFWSSKIMSESRSSETDDFLEIPIMNPIHHPARWYYSEASEPQPQFIKETNLLDLGISSVLTSKELSDSKSEHGIKKWKLTIRDKPVITLSKGKHLVGQCQIKSILTEGGQGIIYDLVNDPKSPDFFNSALRLDENQTSYLINNLELLNKANYEYKSGVLLSELELDKEYLLPSGESCRLEKSETIDAGKNIIETLDYDLLNNSKPHPNLIPNPMSLEVTYNWINFPPSRPSKSSSDSLEKSYSESIGIGIKAIDKLKTFADQQQFTRIVKSIDNFHPKSTVEPIRKADELREWIKKIHDISAEIKKEVDIKTGGENPDAMEIARGGARMPKVKIPEINILPSVDLPESGLLFSQGKSFYLEITNWDIINEAKDEAERYGATLVAKKSWNE